MASAAPATSGAMLARSIAAGVLAKLDAIDTTLSRLLETAQSSRLQLDVVGTVTGGGTVGQTPASCTVAPPLGKSPGTILDRNPHRRGLYIKNLSAAAGPSLTIGLGQQSPQPGTGWVLLPGEVFNGLISNELWTGTVVVVGSAPATLFSYGETYGPNQRDRGRNQPV